MFGKPINKKRTSFSQLSVYIHKFNQVFVGSVYTYRSLLLFKLIKESPLNFRVSRLLFRLLQSSFVIVGFHVSKVFSELDYVQLIKDNNSLTKDKLKVHSKQKKTEEKEAKLALKLLKNGLKKLGCFPLKTIKTPPGTSIHYAGTMPFSESGELFTTTKDGKLSQTNLIYVADASSFNYLPAKGVTLTAMANAHRVAIKSLKN